MTEFTEKYRCECGHVSWAHWSNGHCSHCECKANTGKRIGEHDKTEKTVVYFKIAYRINEHDPEKQDRVACAELGTYLNALFRQDPTEVDIQPVFT